MKIAAQLYTVVQHMQTPGDMRESLKKIKDIGYDTIQLSSQGPIDPNELKNYIDENNLTVCASHNEYDDFIHNTDKVIKDNEIWGCKYIGLGSMPDQFRTGKDGIIKFAKEIIPVAKYIKDAGYKFMYHNHAFDFIKYDGITTISYLTENSNADEVGILADMMWVQMGGINPIEFIQTYKDRLDVIHLKDMTVNYKSEWVIKEIGNGNMNYKAICEACEKHGIKWGAVEQDICDGDPFDSLKMSYNYLNTLGYR